MAKPFIKWVGGKRQLLPELLKYVPNEFGHYYEPFVGGGALFFALQSAGKIQHGATLSDMNVRLIKTYTAIRDSVEELITYMSEDFEYDEEMYYDTRWHFNEAVRVGRAGEPYSDVLIAAYFIYLNKTCFPEGSQVLTASEELIEVETLRPGESLWNGRTVKHVTRRKYDGDMVKLTLQGVHADPEMTADHPVRAIRARTLGSKQDTRTLKELKEQIELIPATELVEGDMVLVPLQSSSDVQTPIDFSTFMPDAEDMGPQARKLDPAWLGNTDRICRLLGYYAANGSARNVERLAGPRVQGVEFTFTNKREKEIYDVCSTIQDVFDIEPIVVTEPGPAGGKTTITVCSASVGNFLINLVPGKTWAKKEFERKSKHLHSALMTLPESQQLELLKGWLGGDGGHRIRGTSVEVSGCSVIKRLAWQFWRIACRCRLRPLWRESLPKTKSHPEGEPLYNVVFSMACDVECLGYPVPPPGRIVVQRRIVDNCVISRVRSVERRHFNGYVFNVEVDGDHLICVDGIVSHNCFNGLYRESKNGTFNVPRGRFAKPPKVLDADNLRACSQALQGVELKVAGFDTVGQSAVAGDLTYFDPPYIPMSATSSFTSYGAGGFDNADQVRLRNCARRLKDRNVSVILSNSSAPAARELYAGPEFQVVEVDAKRALNCDGGKRGNVKELIIY